MTSPRLYKQFFSLGGSQNTTQVSLQPPNFPYLPSPPAYPGTPTPLTLPSSTIPVTSTVGFTSTGTINIPSVTGNNTTQNNNISYTGITGSSFTGCTGGTGSVSNGTVVTQTSVPPSASWTAPPGVKWVIVTGCGGGGGGGAGASISSSNNAYPLFVWCIAGGGGGGQAATTNTHVLNVVPGATYPISIGLGGIGGTVNGVWNGAPYQGPAVYPNNYGGATWGTTGSAGQNTLFGTTIFFGGQGGRRGEIILRAFTPNEIDYFQSAGTGFPGSNANTNFDPGANPIGSSQFNKTDASVNAFPAAWPNPVLGGQIVQARSYGIWNPPAIASANFTLDQVLTAGIINNSVSLVGNAAAQGLSNLWTGGNAGSGGGGGGGISGNIYSQGGVGGQGAQGFAGYPFSGGGAFGVYGGGGGGGGGGEGLNYNNTHDGGPGGNGGSGFVEIAWIQ